MEIFEKVRKYLYENIGHMTTAGTPKYDLKEDVWKVPVLCKTERGIIIVGEFHADKNGNFTNIPTKEEMLRTVKQEMKKLPFLYYGTKKDLDKQKIKPVAVSRKFEGVHLARKSRKKVERFPEGKFRDVEGLVKLVDKAELKENDWSLMPGRYVGVAPEEEDPDFDFGETMRTIHAELDGLNNQAVELAEKINENFRKMGI